MIRLALSLLLASFACAGASTPAAEEQAMPLPPPPKSGLPPLPGASTPEVGVDVARDRYVAWLGARQRPTSPVVEGTLPGAGAWRFFYVGGAPGVKSDPAAVGPEAVVAAGQPDGWAGLLASGDPAAVHGHVAWLHGAWAALAPDTALAESVLGKHPDARPHLAPPLREEIAGGVRFTAWYFEPPARVPFRHVITATAGETTFRREKLSEIAAP